MKKSKSKRAEMYVKNLQRKKLQKQRLFEWNSQLLATDKEINKEIEKFLKAEVPDFNLLSTLYERNVQWLDKIIMSVKEDSIEDEFDFLQYYHLSRELNISMKELHQCLDFKLRFGVWDEKKIEDLVNQCSLIRYKLDKLIHPEGNNQKAIGYEVSEILLDTIRQSILNQSKELMN